MKPEARLASVILVVSLFFLAVAVVMGTGIVYQIQTNSADHKAQLNRVIELLEKKP